MYIYLLLTSVQHYMKFEMASRAGGAGELGRWDGRKLWRGGETETNVSTDRAILNILRHHIENDVFTTFNKKNQNFAFRGAPL